MHNISRISPHFHCYHLSLSHHHLSCGLLDPSPDWYPSFAVCSFQSVLNTESRMFLIHFVAFLLRMSPWLPISLKIKAKVTALTCKALYHLPLVVFLTAFSFSLKTYTSSFQESIQHDMIPSQCLCTGHSLRLYTAPQRATWLAPSHLSHFCVKKAFMDNLSKITVTAHRIPSPLVCFPFFLNAYCHIANCLFYLSWWFPVSPRRICKLYEGKNFFLVYFVRYIGTGP